MDEIDLKHLAQMDIRWLESRGWTVSGNLAYRRHLDEWQPRQPFSLERIEQICLQYELPPEQIQLIKESLQELFELAKTINSMIARNP